MEFLFILFIFNKYFSLFNNFIPNVPLIYLNWTVLNVLKSKVFIAIIKNINFHT